MNPFHTVRFCHLAGPSPYSEGDTVTRGTVVGVMGNSGQSTGPHLHIDCVDGVQKTVYRLNDMYANDPMPNFQQLTYFIDRELGDGPFRITTYPYDYRYVINGKWKPHPGYDLVLTDPKIYWNRSMNGSVILKGYDNGYGHYVNISFRG
jgi:murein DD-endopeptidase MepM/ murein hydrolase activator NlpD